MHYTQKSNKENVAFIPYTRKTTGAIGDGLLAAIGDSAFFQQTDIFTLAINGHMGNKSVTWGDIQLQNTNNHFASISIPLGAHGGVCIINTS